MSEWYVLDSDGAVRGVSFEEWSAWRGANPDSNRVARTDLDSGVFVSTVFLGLDHGGGPTPILFETMIFGGLRDNYRWRYRSVEAARAGHEAIVAALKAGTDPDEAVPE